MLPHFENVCSFFVQKKRSATCSGNPIIKKLRTTSCFGQRRLKPAPPRDGGEKAAPPKEEVDGCTTAREEEKQDRSKGRQREQPRFFANARVPVLELCSVVGTDCLLVGIVPWPVYLASILVVVLANTFCAARAR